MYFEPDERTYYGPPASNNLWFLSLNILWHLNGLTLCFPGLNNCWSSILNICKSYEQVVRVHTYCSVRIGDL